MGAMYELTLCSLVLFHIVICLLLGSLIWYLLFHYCCRFHSRAWQWHEIQKLEYNVVPFLYVAGTTCTPVGVCTEPRGVCCKGRHVLCVCIAVRRVQTCFLPLQTSCATLLPGSIAQVLVTSLLAPHFTATTSQQDGRQMKCKNFAQLYCEQRCGNV